MSVERIDMGTEGDNRGSIWRRWDPHLHAPGTLLSDQFADDWEGYLAIIESAAPPVEAIGVTDYFCINTYREMLKYKTAGRIPSVQLLFPNVELRLNLRTDRSSAINIHLLFSPESKDHIQQIERMLAQLQFDFQKRYYRCTLGELRELGQAFDPKQTDPRGALEAGANQFKVSLDQLKDLFRKEVWLQKNCLVAVSGSGVDGTSGLKADDSFTATRREIETYAHLVFSASEKQRAFWLGKSESTSAEEIVSSYGSIKACIHGSDAHEHARVLAPDKDRFCWIKGDPTFESLRQVTLEPEDRVWIGRNPPNQGNPALCISEVRAIDAPWVATDRIPLNQGLVTIIGAKGSGKTALVDMIAAGSGVLETSENQSSFLGRADGLLGDARVETIWGDDSKIEKPLRKESSGDFDDVFETEIRDREAVCYLSQHFVEKLCAASGLAVELKREVERVIFESMDPTEHLEADSFDELHERLTGPIQQRRSDLQQSIRDTGEKIVAEENLKSTLPQLKKREENLRLGIDSAKKSLKAMVPKEDEGRANFLSKLEDAQVEVEGRVEELRKRRNRLNELAKEITHLREVKEPARFDRMVGDFRDAGLTETEWKAFRMEFTGNASGIIVKALTGIDSRISKLTGGDLKKEEWKVQGEPDTWPLNRILEELKKQQQDISAASQQKLKYDNIQKETRRNEIALRRLQGEIQHAEGAFERREKLILSRRKSYVQIFETFSEEESALNKIYEPLRQGLKDAVGSLSQLTFGVRRKVDLNTWVSKGESLIDLRSTSRFRGRGSLPRIAKEYLLKAWESGTADDVAEAMERFRKEYQQDLLKARPASMHADGVSPWQQSVADWLYSTNHISLEYGIQYNSVSIEQLSPGTRGIVLLHLYLAIDENDRRPLIIDQPEENLDPNSVFTELVPHFRNARKRRQVIVVTHNANLVVNTDAEQVIVAHATQSPEGGLPKMTYQSGSLENPEIRRLVCELLEGGERAFLEREKRYRLKWTSGALA